MATGLTGAARGQRPEGILLLVLIAAAILAACQSQRLNECDPSSSPTPTKFDPFCRHSADTSCLGKRTEIFHNISYWFSREFGAPKRIRTSDPQKIRSLMLPGRWANQLN